MTNYYVSSVAFTAVSTWAALTSGVATAVSLGQYVRNTSPAADATGVDSNQRVWKCTTAGTTSTTEPTAWSTTSPGNDGSTTTDGTVVWTEVMGREAEQVAGTWHAPAPDVRSMITCKNPTAGDTIFISSDHAETYTVPSFVAFSPTTNVAASRNVRYISVSRTGTHLPPIAADITSGASLSAAIAATSVTYGLQWAYYSGITFHLTDTGAQNNQIKFEGSSGTNPSGQKCILENCLLLIDSTGLSSSIVIGDASAGSALVEWINTAIKYTGVAASPAIALMQFASLIWRDTPSNAVQGTAPDSLLGVNTVGSNTQGFATLRGLDLSGCGAGKLINPVSTVGPTRISLENCKLSATVTDANIIAKTKGSTDDALCLSVDNCDNSTSGRNWRMFRAYSMGIVKSVSSPARDTGASDGVTGISWAFSSISDTRFGTLPNVSLQGPQIVRRYDTTGSSKTLTVEMLYNGTALLTNAQAWIEAEVLGTAGVPLSGTISSGIATPLTTAGNLSTSTKTWDAPARVNSHAYVLGDVISTTSNVGPVFFCTTAGTSASSEPGGYASAVDGGSVTDGTAHFRAGFRMSASVTFTAQVKGMVRVIPRFAVTNDAFHFFVDPMLTIT
jgi:hypothetical protein